MRSWTVPANQRVFVASDTHYGHANILKYCLRPWLSPERRADVLAGRPVEVTEAECRSHDDALVDNINWTVGPGDLLLILGDVAWGREKLAEFRSRLGAFEVVVCVGNHDDEDELAEVFGRSRVFERLMLVVEGSGGDRKFVCDHFPAHSWEQSHHGTGHLFGHVHGRLDHRRLGENQFALTLDVGVDSHDYKPWNLREEIIPLFDRSRPRWKTWRDVTYGDKDRGAMARSFQ